jgi:hypothetical protein
MIWYLKKKQRLHQKTLKSDKHFWQNSRIQNQQTEVVEWLKWYSTCLAGVRPWIQTQVLPKTKQKQHTKSSSFSWAQWLVIKDRLRLGVSRLEANLNK